MNQGFTLLELMVVLTIVAILSAVAAPQYSQYRARAFDSRAISDLRNLAIAQEVYFLDNQEYLSCSNLSCLELPGINRISDGVEIEIRAGINSFTGLAKHERGSGKEFFWNSEEGGLLE